MRLLESIDHTAWATCQRCGNTYSGGQRCSRCGQTPTLLQRLASFSNFSNGKKGGSRAILRRTRSRGAYPGLAETALLFDQERRRRMTRIALACAICAVAVATYFFAAPHLAGIGLHPRADDAHILVAGPVIKSGAATAPGTNVLPTPSSQLNSGRNADTKSVTNENARTQNPDVSEFYRSLQSRNLFVAHRRLAGMSENGKGPGQLEQMHADLASREHMRDEYMQRARHCRDVDDWQCVSENATQASAIDASSVQAKRLVALAAKEMGNGSGGLHRGRAIGHPA
ncbi:MAG: hypothetical protein JWQ50_3363 [Caballeronia mineralivorans]|jgi:hypothetical protein|nr:hypothetical protein [Caballeronia mineralivorans]MEA3098905.1 hypothetical protein [Caballeronia mineralivorans]